MNSIEDDNEIIDTKTEEKKMENKVPMNLSLIHISEPTRPY